MAHFAQIDENNIVVNIIVAEQGFIDSGSMGDPEKWVQTSYNNNIRGMYAGIGYVYIPECDVFVGPKPHESWSFDSNIKNWNSPVEMPENPSEGMMYIWDENTLNWKETPDLLPE